MTDEHHPDEAPPEPAGEIEAVLRSLGRGDHSAADQLLPLVYGELRRLAGWRLRQMPPGQTLQATALVHEAYMKLLGGSKATWEDRRHFFNAAARAMRDILVDQSRRKGTIKRGGDRRREAFASDDTPSIEAGLPAEDILALDASLDALAREHPRPAQIVMLRYFGGLTNEQIALALDLNERTVRRDWRFAQAWLYGRLSDGVP